MSDDRLSTLATNSPAMVLQEIDQQWKLILSHPATRQIAEQTLSDAGARVSLDAISADGSTPFTTERAREGSGSGIVEAVVVKVAVNVASAAATAALALLWKKVIAPQIEKRFGKIEGNT